MSKKNISVKSEPEAVRGAAAAAAFAGELPPMESGAFKGARIRSGATVIREATEAVRRGRPPKGSVAKVQQSLRLSREVIDHFRAQGAGWQARMDEVLKASAAMQAVVEAAGGFERIFERQRTMERALEAAGGSRAIASATKVIDTQRKAIEAMGGMAKLVEAQDISRRAITVLTQAADAGAAMRSVAVAGQAAGGRKRDA